MADTNWMAQVVARNMAQNGATTTQIYQALVKSGIPTGTAATIANQFGHATAMGAQNAQGQTYTGPWGWVTPRTNAPSGSTTGFDPSKYGIDPTDVGLDKTYGWIYPDGKGNIHVGVSLGEGLGYGDQILSYDAVYNASQKETTPRKYSLPQGASQLKTDPNTGAVYSWDEDLGDYVNIATGTDQTGQMTEYQKNTLAADVAAQKHQEEMDAAALKRQLEQDQNTNIFNARTLMSNELDKLQALQQTPRSWIEASQRSAMLANSPWWAPTVQQAETIPTNGGVEQQGLVEILKTLANKLIPQAGTSGIPNTPDWLAKMSEVPGQAGHPLSGAEWKLPSAQQWGNMSNTQQEMFKGYSDWAGPQKSSNQWSDVWGLLQKLWPTWNTPATARYGAAYQR